MKSTSLFRPRPRNDARWLCFGHGPTEAYVRRTLQDELLRHLRRWEPRETIGLLAGRVCHDSDGTYTIVEAAEAAAEDEIESTPGSVRISGRGQLNVRKRLEREHVALDIVGWWHTHPRYSAVFSPEDIREQSTWTGEGSVGIVVSGLSNADLLGVYCGSNAVRLKQVTTDQFFEPIHSHAAPAPQQKVVPKTNPSQHPARPSPRFAWPEPIHCAAVTVAVALILSVSIIGMLYSRLNGRISAVEKAIDTERRAASEKSQEQDDTDELVPRPDMPSSAEPSSNVAEIPYQSNSISKPRSGITGQVPKARLVPKSRPPVKQPNTTKKQNTDATSPTPTIKKPTERSN